MDDNNVQNSLCITSMKQELSGPTEAHGPFISLLRSLLWGTVSNARIKSSTEPPLSRVSIHLSITCSSCSTVDLPLMKPNCFCDNSLFCIRCFIMVSLIMDFIVHNMHVRLIGR